MLVRAISANVKAPFFLEFSIGVSAKILKIIHKCKQIPFINKFISLPPK